MLTTTSTITARTAAASVANITANAKNAYFCCCARTYVTYTLLPVLPLISMLTNSAWYYYCNNVEHTQAIATGWSDQEGVLKVMRATAFLQRAEAHRRALTALTDRSALLHACMHTALHCTIHTHNQHVCQCIEHAAQLHSVSTRVSAVSTAYAHTALRCYRQHEHHNDSQCCVRAAQLYRLLARVAAVRIARSYCQYWTESLCTLTTPMCVCI
jgi:hypothetical protein